MSVELEDDVERVTKCLVKRGPLVKPQCAEMGATVIDAPPDELAAQLADAYLRFKARSRL